MEPPFLTGIQGPFSGECAYRDHIRVVGFPALCPWVLHRMGMGQVALKREKMKSRIGWTRKEHRVCVGSTLAREESRPVSLNSLVDREGRKAGFNCADDHGNRYLQ